MISSSILTLVIWLIILGVLAWVIDMAPFIEGTFKTFIRYALIVVAAVLVVVFLLALVNGGSPNLFIK